MRKRKILTIILIISLLFMIGCSPAVPSVTDESLLPPDLSAPPQNSFPDTDNQETQPFNGLSVHYLDVGHGDSILICFPDGENMLIDCGSSSPKSINTIIGALEVKEIACLDYLVLTHPDSDHIGGVKEVFKDVAVEKVYHPDIIEGFNEFEEYYSAIEFLKGKGAEMKISLQGECFGEDFKLAFLYPQSRNQKTSSYYEFLWSMEHTETQINDLSPYIYLEYNEVRFLFTGDAGSKQEEKLIADYNSSILNQTFIKSIPNLKLEDIDFLKIAHHGSNDSSCQEFLDLLKPKNAIISVSGDNTYGHPTTSVLKRLQTANPNHKVYRTDKSGTISIFVGSDMTISVKTDRN